MNNNDWMLAAAHDGNTVVNELPKTNSKFISMAKTISRSLSAISLKAVYIASLNPFIPKKYRSEYILREAFDRCLISLDETSGLRTYYVSLLAEDR